MQAVFQLVAQGAYGLAALHQFALGELAGGAEADDGRDVLGAAAQAFFLAAAVEQRLQVDP